MLSFIIGELFGASLPFILTYVATGILPLAPIIPVDNSNFIILNSTITSYVKNNPRICLCLIPTMIYCIGRVYFEIVRFIHLLIPFPSVGK
jgi:hypothetical protein